MRLFIIHEIKLVITLDIPPCFDDSCIFQYIFAEFGSQTIDETEGFGQSGHNSNTTYNVYKLRCLGHTIDADSVFGDGDYSCYEAQIDAEYDAYTDVSPSCEEIQVYLQDGIHCVRCVDCFISENRTPTKSKHDKKSKISYNNIKNNYKSIKTIFSYNYSDYNCIFICYNNNIDNNNDNFSKYCNNRCVKNCTSSTKHIAFHLNQKQRKNTDNSYASLQNILRYNYNYYRCIYTLYSNNINTMLKFTRLRYIAKLRLCVCVDEYV